MKCQKCDSKRIITINAKCNDLFSMTTHDGDGGHYHGYVPVGIGLDDGGDNLKIHICVECGQLQGVFPVTELALFAAVSSLRS